MEVCLEMSLKCGSKRASGGTDEKRTNEQSWVIVCSLTSSFKNTQDHKRAWSSLSNPSLTNSVKLSLLTTLSLSIIISEMKGLIASGLQGKSIASRKYSFWMPPHSSPMTNAHILVFCSQENSYGCINGSLKGKCCVAVEGWENHVIGNIPTSVECLLCSHGTLTTPLALFSSLLGPSVPLHNYTSIYVS